KDPAEALGLMASAWWNYPSETLKLVGVTGTNGKTTTVTLLYHLFESLGYKTGLLSTVLNKIHDREFPATHTTPDALQINRLLNQMVDLGCDFAFMEVSSHAIEQNRIAGLQFAGAVFTNITHDHLDYHKTYKNYLEAKKKLFTGLPQKAFALTNADDRNGRVILQNTKANKYTYGLKSMADFKGKVLENHFNGLLMQVDGEEFNALLPGEFNAYNLMSTYATALLLGQDKTEVLVSLSKAKGAEGRFEIIRSNNNITGIVDYAHTPDALKNVLETINQLRTRNEQLITVVGAGGDRDKEKRPKMALVVSTLSDRVILTSDNPRSEKPEQIIEDMRIGVDPAKSGKTMIITNRREAIKTAVNLARPGDLILLAGKGHEKYQEIKGMKYPFDDKKILTEYLETA
ncbi:MAG TPA: UDP-N-acetylmuramoyl-L-alanyl-D-glutamate--2,6-diaminopimelate ligase, partial [Bacteroidetes bacterium]|nr:UDP-N-acetylmuramoyl-L-alanyl-D-glutamate--2,6-diaminopimelate ligase [Bacteroidota bacterium]